MINAMPTAPGVDGIASMSSLWAMVDAARAGAADARSAAGQVLPAAGRLISQGVHATGFLIGFGVCFPAVLLARVVPQNNCIVFGLADGGRAGLDLARETLQPTPQPALAVAVLEG